MVSAQSAIAASPISAAVVYMSSVMEGHGIATSICSRGHARPPLLAVLVMSFLVAVLNFKTL
ncbi:anaerobic C4-dicarboxylate transporter family protein [Escherichia coli]